MGEPPAARAATETPPGEVVRGTVTRRATLGSLLADHASPAALDALVRAARPIYDLARLDVGRPFALALDPRGELASFRYGLDDLRTLFVKRKGKELLAEVLSREYETRVESALGVVRSSLFLAVEDSGEGDELALALAEIFAWDVDFNTEVQVGDRFRVAVEKLYLDGRFVRYGPVLAAEFVRGERVLRAVRFEAKEQTGYFDPDGNPLRKAFLRSPLRFTRISSRFSRARFHPILKTTRPHLGVDYAAPAGTPVLAAGRGVVTLAGWLGGFGRTVKVRHPNGYETLYAHLARLLVRSGQRVEQGQELGTVGSTGLATGPHLDYRMTKDGSFVDPLRLESPPAEPLKGEERPVFAREQSRLLALLPAAESDRSLSAAQVSEAERFLLLQLPAVVPVPGQ
jgi:murein DD-endopeptidase MepM/ murein hydrolase activator NlpD